MSPHMHRRGKGYIPDGPDSRDKLYSTLMTTKVVQAATPQQDFQTVLYTQAIAEAQLGEGGDLSNATVPVYNQGGLGSCVANATAAALRYAEHKISGKELDTTYNPSRSYIWWYAKQLGGIDPRSDSGCQIRNAIKSLNKFGCCSDESWPYPDPANAIPDNGRAPGSLSRGPSAGISNDARSYQQLNFEYFRIKVVSENPGDSDPAAVQLDRVHQIRSAIAEGYPVIFGVGEYGHTDAGGNETYTLETVGNDNFQNATPDADEKRNFHVNMCWPPQHGGKPVDLDNLQQRISGHAMLIVGSHLTKRVFLVQNSWGLYPDVASNQWYKPYFWMPYEYFETRSNGFQFVDDIWVIKEKGKEVAPAK